MITAIGKYLRVIRINTGDSLRTMATTLDISASYLSAIENGKRNIPTGFLEIVFEAYSIPDNERKDVKMSIYNSINNYKIDLSNLSDKKRQVLLSVAKEELDETTIDKLYKIVSDSSNDKTEKL